MSSDTSVTPDLRLLSLELVIGEDALLVQSRELLDFVGARGAGRGGILHAGPLGLLARHSMIDGSLVHVAAMDDQIHEEPKEGGENDKGGPRALPPPDTSPSGVRVKHCIWGRHGRQSVS